jgi:hypothetical protein
MFLGSKVRGCIGLTTLLPSVSRLSRQCGILNISQPYRPPRLVTGTALLSFFYSSKPLQRVTIIVCLYYVLTHNVLHTCEIIRK